MSKITIKNARLSFPSLFNKAVFNGQEGKYEATFLFPKTDTKTYDTIMKAIEDTKTEHKLGKVPASKLCIKDGDEIEYDGYEGMWAVKAGNTKRPLLIDGQKVPVVEEDNKLYAGCFCNAIISLWAQNNDFGKRVNANVLGVQFTKHGEPFGDAVVADSDEFDEIEDDEEDL